MKLAAVVAISAMLLAIGALLVRFNFIVMDGCVTRWQVRPIQSRGAIRNDCEYRAVSYYVEQVFTAGGFDDPGQKALVDQLNQLLAAYDGTNQKPGICFTL